MGTSKKFLKKITTFRIFMYQVQQFHHLKARACSFSFFKHVCSGKDATSNEIKILIAMEKAVVTCKQEAKVI